MGFMSAYGDFACACAQGDKCKKVQSWKLNVEREKNMHPTKRTDVRRRVITFTHIAGSGTASHAG